MNNPFKLIFLIFNLVPSLTSSVNNYSQPLSETELKIGQNVSEIVKRDEPITLVGGAIFTGYMFGNKGEVYQRPCTLAFPVVNKENGEKGFLTSRSCTNGNILVGETTVGIAAFPNGFSPERGLNYVFVRVFDSYWEDNISRNITYFQCDSTGSGDKLISLIPTPSQPPLNSKVCAYGGVSGFTCGEIIELNATIRVEVPGASPSEQPVLFSDVIKVRMNQPYSLGDLGAPVYIPLQVPNSTQFIASPVGMVVENYDGEEEEANIWYYTPLEKILENTGLLTIESGDLSYLLPPNNTESDNDFLTDDLGSGTNVSDSDFVRRQPEQPQVVDVHAGFRVWVFGYSIPDHRIPSAGDVANLCTLGFAIKRVDGLGRSRFDHGFLTLGDCMPSNRRGFINTVFYTPTQNWVREEAIRLGNAGSLKYDPASGLNYAIVRLLPNNDQLTLWDDDVSADMPVMWGDEERMVEVYNRARAPNDINLGAELCWWGSASKHMCGVVVDTRATLTRLNPWRWPIYVDMVIPLIINGQPIPIELQWNPEDTFQNLIKVRLDNPRQPRAEEPKHDRSSPVYYPYFNRLGLVTQAQPVGILLDYIWEIENMNNQCVLVWYMYCLSVDKILRDSRITGNELQLIGENFA